MVTTRFLLLCAVSSLSLTVHSAIAKNPAPEVLLIRALADTVGVYDKFEVGLNLKAQFVNPFNPDEIDLTAIFTAPSGRQWKIHGYYDNSRFTLWKIRFSPDERGKWSYTMQITDKNGKTSVPLRSFTVIPSSFSGPLHIASNKRYLEHADGKSFYGVGFWYNDGYSGFGGGQVKPEVLDELKDLGVNFIASFIIPLETIGTGLGRYDQGISGRLDSVLKLCEDRELVLSLNIWFHAFLSDTTWPPGRWFTNPYNSITAAKDFYHSTEAWGYQEKLYRYMIARWGYSRALGDWMVMDEVNGTDGWAGGDSVGAGVWAQKVQGYFAANDPYRHMTFGTRSGGIQEWWPDSYRLFDMAAREIYEAQGHSMDRRGTVEGETIHPLTRSYANYSIQVDKLWQGFEKPAIIAESGWDHVFYDPSMPGYLSLYHDAMWVCLCSGTAMTPFWWAYNKRMNENMISSQLTAIRNFTDQIPFARLSHPGKANVSVSKGDAYAIKSDEMIFGWVANPQTDVAGKTVKISGVNAGRYRLRIYHTWKGQFLDTTELSASNGSLSFTIPILHMDSHANYIGPDIAFIAEPLSAGTAMLLSPKGTGSLQ
ncbi:MAG: DUF5060 domain-containing protein [Puia sp.]|nr:DUF5060 domain-containing protein [Puia sp.]